MVVVVTRYAGRWAGKRVLMQARRQEVQARTPHWQGRQAGYY